MTQHPGINFCSSCGERVTLRVPPGDNRPRFVCDHCDTVHYQNPKIVAGCIVEHGGRILLCRRAIEPRRGLWTCPAGFMENGETTPAAAARETFEEAMARVRVHALHSVFNLPHISQVYMLFRAELSAPEFGPGEESLEVELFDESAIPWDEIAFPVIGAALRLYFEDRAQGVFKVHVGDMERLPGEPRRYRTGYL